MDSTKKSMKNFFSDVYKNMNEIMIGAVIISFLLGNMFFFLDFKLVVVFSVDRVILIIAFLYCAYQFLKRRKEHKVPRFLLAVWVFFFAWLIYGVAWLLFSKYRSDAISEISSLATNFGLMFCLGYLIDTNEKLNLALKCLKFCGIFLSILLIVQLFTGFVFPCSRYTDPKILSYMKSYNAPIVPTTMFNNENDMSSYIMLVISLYFSDLLFSHTGKEFVKTLVKLTFLFFAVVVINSTITFIALAFMFVTGLLCAFAFHKNRDTVFQKKLAGKGLAALADFGIFYTLIGSPIETALRNSGRAAKAILSEFLISCHILSEQNFLNSTNELVNLSNRTRDTLVSQIHTYTQHQGTIFVRLNLIIQGLKISVAHLLFGIGPASFEHYMLEHPETTKGTNGIINPHNFWIEVLAQYGIFFFLAFAVIFVKMMVDLFKIQRNAFNKVTLGLFLTGIMFFFAIIIPSSCVGLYPVWVVFAVLVAGATVYRSDKTISAEV